MRKIVAGLVTALLVGCTTIPTTGPIQEVPFSAEPGGIDIAPQPPADNATPSRLVDGFLQAMAVPEGDYGVAREYLTGAAAEAWDPAANLTIYEGRVQADGQAASIMGARVGSLDGTGRYRPHGDPYAHDFGLQQVDGQWRIGNPPDGLLLSRYLFERYYARLTLYFISRTGSHVVPDPVYVHETRATPSAVVEGLMRGPSESLARVVSNAIPQGVGLGPDGATIDARGVVRVDLTGLDLALSDDSRRRLGAELLWSLTSIPRVTGLAVQRDGMPFAIPGANAAGVLELATQQGYQVLSRASTTDLFGVREGAPGRIPGVNQFERWSGVELRAADLAVSLDGATVALVDQLRGGVSFGPLTGDFSPVRVGLTNLRAPQFALGSLWVLGDNVGGTPTLATIDRTDRVTLIDVDLPGGARIHDFAVSPTRAQVAIVLDVQGTLTLGMASIVGANPERRARLA